MKPDKPSWALWVALALPIAWLAMVLADVWQPDANLNMVLAGFEDWMAAPFAFRWNERTGPFLMVCLGVYAFAVYYYETDKARRRPGEERGSAKWGSAGALNRRYADRRNPCHNAILTQNIRIGLDGRKHKRNLNVLVIGGSGSGKTRYYAKPNIMQADGRTSYFICDPKGGATRS